jgi:hypothetical protein
VESRRIPRLMPTEPTNHNFDLTLIGARANVELYPKIRCRAKAGRMAKG